MAEKADKRKRGVLMNVYEKIKLLEIVIPKTPAKGGIYAKAREFGDGFIYISGCGPTIDGEASIVGKVGDSIKMEEAQHAARNCMLNVLAVIEEAIGDLNKVKSFVKNTTFVACNNDFYLQPQVANAGSELLIDIFGDDIGSAARSAVGVNCLPGNISVETEMLIEIKR